ncbi:MAG: (d)CMP kinase [Polyangiaceae bacterium]|jgi:cytidylate kinase|nr:(d)CMP kinase [Polyangiaceae bacterium]
MVNRARLIVAIDGPAGAGKSTVAKRVAERLGYVLIDTGAMYRCVALAAARTGLLPETLTGAPPLSNDTEAAIGALATRLASARKIELEPSGRTLLDGEDVSHEIRSPEVSLGASRVSAIPEVRAALLAMQRQAGEQGGAVLEGRDIGTVVFPGADAKFFLTASAEQRAGRRHAELQGKGTKVTFDETLEDVIRRDRADTDRPVAPLKQADDAVLVDSSKMSIDDVVELIVREVSTREAAR